MPAPKSRMPDRPVRGSKRRSLGALTLWMLWGSARHLRRSARRLLGRGAEHEARVVGRIEPATENAGSGKRVRKAA